MNLLHVGSGAHARDIIVSMSLSLKPILDVSHAKHAKAAAAPSMCLCILYVRGPTIHLSPVASRAHGDYTDQAKPGPGVVIGPRDTYYYSGRCDLVIVGWDSRAADAR